jgi:hypothetical protein
MSAKTCHTQIRTPRWVGASDVSHRHDVPPDHCNGWLAGGEGRSRGGPRCLPSLDDEGCGRGGWCACCCCCFASCGGGGAGSSTLPPIGAPCTRCLRHSDPIHARKGLTRGRRLIHSASGGGGGGGGGTRWHHRRPASCRRRRRSHPLALAGDSRARGSLGCFPFRRHARQPRPLSLLGLPLRIRRLLGRRARNASGTATQSTRGKGLTAARCSSARCSSARSCCTCCCSSAAARCDASRAITSACTFANNRYEGRAVAQLRLGCRHETAAMPARCA